MSYVISASEDNKYIILKYMVDFKREMTMRSIIEAHVLGEQLEINRYLVDLTESRNRASAFTNYEFGYRDLGAQPAFNPAARVALLTAPGDDSHDFLETVMLNAGFDVTMFKDRELAVQHLEEG